MVISKPFPVIWLGGSVLFDTSDSAAGRIQYRLFHCALRFYNQPFSDMEKKRRERSNGRTACLLSEMPDIDEWARKLLQASWRASKGGAQMTPRSDRKNVEDLKREVLGRLAEVPPGGDRIWVYKSLPVGFDRPLYFRYRVYVSKVSSESQRLTRGWWGVRIAEPETEETKPANVFEKDKQAQKKYKYSFFAMTPYPEQIMSGTFLEKDLPPKIIDPNGEVMIRFENQDPAGAALCFQKADGPKLLIKYTGFTQNYFGRCWLYSCSWSLRLACAAASILSPTVFSWWYLI
jgi:hypothetical protein